MKKYFASLLIFLLLAGAQQACRKVEPAKLIDLRNISLGQIVDNEAQIRGEAILYNPNSFGVRIKEIMLTVEIESVNIATLREAKSVKAGNKSEFTVPFQGRLALSDIQKIVEKDGLAYLLGKKVPVRFKGHVKTSLGGWGTTIPVDMKEEISLGKLISQ